MGVLPAVFTYARGIAFDVARVGVDLSKGGASSRITWSAGFTSRAWTDSIAWAARAGFAASDRTAQDWAIEIDPAFVVFP